MEAEVGIDSGRDVSIYTHCGNYPNLSKLALYISCYFTVTSILNSCS